MASNTGSAVVANQTFTTSPVPIVVGVLNPTNTPQTVWDCGVGMNYASMTTSVTGSPASFTILLEGTYDGTNWFQLASTSVVGGETTYSSGALTFTNLRARCTAVSGGSSPTVNVFVTASQNVIATTSAGTAPGITVSQGNANTALSPGWRVAEGSVTANTHLNGASAIVTGSPADYGASCQSFTFQVVAGAGTTAGAVTFFGSIDGTTYVPLTTAVNLGSTGAPTLTNGVMTFTAPSTALVSLGANLSAIRFLRCDVTTNMTGGTVTVKSQAF